MIEALVLGLSYLATVLGYGLILALMEHVEPLRLALLGPPRAASGRLLVVDVVMRSLAIAYLYEYAVAALVYGGLAEGAAELLVAALAMAHSMALLVHVVRRLVARLETMKQ